MIRYPDFTAQIVQRTLQQYQEMSPSHYENYIRTLSYIKRLHLISKIFSKILNAVIALERIVYCCFKFVNLNGPAGTHFEDEMSAR